MCRLRNEEALLLKSKRVGSTDMPGKPGKASATARPAPASAKPRRSTNDAPSVSSLSISSSSASRLAFGRNIFLTFLLASSELLFLKDQPFLSLKQSQRLRPAAARTMRPQSPCSPSAAPLLAGWLLDRISF